MRKTIPFSMSKEMDVLMQSIMKDAGYNNYQDAIRAGMLTFRWVVDQYMEGRHVVAAELPADTPPLPAGSEHPLKPTPPLKLVKPSAKPSRKS